MRNGTPTPLDHALIHMIDNHLVDVVTNSWGINGEYPHQYGHVIADERAFMQAAATGITVLFSSGDLGDVAASRGVAQASYPSSSPWVTSVGGTSLAVQTAPGAKDEWGWGTYTTTLVGSAPTQTSTTVTGTSLSPWPPAFQYGSGGGTSLHFAPAQLPGWRRAERVGHDHDHFHRAGAPAWITAPGHAGHLDGRRPEHRRPRGRDVPRQW